MNIPEDAVIDITRWFGAIPEIISMIADTDLFTVAGGVLMFAFGWLLAYKLTSIGE